MAPRQIGTVVVNAAVLFATNLAFRAWITHQFGYLDFDMTGMTGKLWVPLVVVAILAVWLGFRVAAMRLVAGLLTGVLAIIVADHAVGALRDGDVTVAGIVTGACMALQCVTLAAGIVVSSREWDDSGTDDTSRSVVRKWWR